MCCVDDCHVVGGGGPVFFGGELITSAFVGA